MVIAPAAFKGSVPAKHGGPLGGAVDDRYGILVICSTVEGPTSEDELMDPDGTRQRLARGAAGLATLVDLGARR